MKGDARSLDHVSAEHLQAARSKEPTGSTVCHKWDALYTLPASMLSQSFSREHRAIVSTPQGGCYMGGYIYLCKCRGIL